jgi:hypothetical protein
MKKRPKPSQFFKMSVLMIREHLLFVNEMIHFYTTKANCVGDHLIPSLKKERFDSTQIF